MSWRERVRKRPATRAHQRSFGPLIRTVHMTLRDLTTLIIIQQM
jgi:hypothetical protein